MVFLCLNILLEFSTAGAERPPLTKNVPISEFQNKAGESGYDLNAPPKGFFHTIQFAKDIDEDVGFRRAHDVVPIDPTDQFGRDVRAVFVVFQLHQHYVGFQITGLCFPEQVEGLDPGSPVTEDAVVVDLEDNSGYLQLFAPPQGWKPGNYKVEIHVGWEVNEVSLMGTMRFTIAS